MKSLSSYSSDIFMFILWTIWLYFLLNIIIVNLMFAIHDLALHSSTCGGGQRDDHPL